MKYLCEIYYLFNSKLNNMKFIKFSRTGQILLNMLLLLVILSTSSCNKENNESGGGALVFELKTEQTIGNPAFVVPGNDYVIEYAGENIKSVTVSNLSDGWSADVDQTSHKVVVKATDNAVQKAKITIKATGNDSKEVSKEVELYCLNSFVDPNGTFVLNEGNMTTENGSLTYITPEGYVIDDAYKAVNGTELGNVAQDMAFSNGKIYVITQNGDENAVGNKFENDGMLIVMNAKTLKKEISIAKSELTGLDWPSHIAVLDDQHVYIRDNKGIYRLDMTDKSLTFVEGSDGAPKSQFAVVDGKVYTYYIKSYIGGIMEISPEKDEVRKIKFPYRLDVSINEVLGMKAADDGDFWIMGSGFGKTAIGKFNISTEEMIQRQISIKPTVGSAGVAFAVKGNDFYYADGTTIYHMTFDSNPDLGYEAGLDSETLLCDVNSLDNNAGMLYNGLAVHPKTGHVYINSIKSFAQFTTNQIWEFDFASSTETPVAKYENYTNFPAGFFFYPDK